MNHGTWMFRKPAPVTCRVSFMMPTSPRLSRLRRVGYSDDDYEVPNMTWWTQPGAAQMMDEKDAQEALALLDQNKRTLKDARDRQHQVRMSRKYNTRCLRCGGDHKTFQRPKPGPGVYMLTPSFPRQRRSFKERRRCMVGPLARPV